MCTQKNIDLFNSYLGANVIFAYQDIGLFDELANAEFSDLDALVTKTKTDAVRLKALLDVGVKMNFLCFKYPNFYQLSDCGFDIKKNIGFFTWCTGGYGAILQQLGNLAKDNSIDWSEMKNGEMIALGSDQCNQYLMNDIFMSTLEKIKFSKVADIGCGNAGRLIKICQKYQHVNAVGIDIDDRALKLAIDNVASKGLTEKISLINVDIFELLVNEKNNEIFNKVDTVMSFMMLHDLFNQEDGVKVCKKLITSFPNAKYFIFADTVKSDEQVVNQSSIPMFSMGFELLHAYMNVDLKEKEYYCETFQKAGLIIDAMFDFGVPNTYLFLLKTNQE